MVHMEKLKFLLELLSCFVSLDCLHHTVVCSNNAMGLWSMIKGKDSQFKGPPALGEVGVLLGFYFLEFCGFCMLSMSINSFFVLFFFFSHRPF